MSGIIGWFSDIEKQSGLSELCKSNLGNLYCVIGIHPDNVDRTNKKSHEGWLEKVEELGRRQECVGILSGLNLAREMGTHFPQESLLRSSCQLADKLLLPLVLHVAPDGGSIEKVLEILEDEGWTNDSLTAVEGDHIGEKRVLLHDAVTACAGNIEKLELVIKAGIYCIVSASLITDSPDDNAARINARACVHSIPVHQLLSCSDAPWKTPQNLDDPYLRTLRNEPCNINAVVQALAEIKGLAVDDLIVTLKENAIKVFGMEYLPQEVAPMIHDSKVGGQGQGHTVESPALNENILEKKNKKTKKAKEMTDQDSGSNEKSITAGDETAKQKDASHLPDREIGQEEQEVLEGSYYGCPKCRTCLFYQSQINFHGTDIAKSVVFKVGEEGSCKTALFLPFMDSIEVKAKTSLSINGNSVACDNCGNKVGKFAVSESTCPCGVIIPGPTVRITSAKVDYFDTNLNGDELVARSLLEAEEANIQQELEEEHDTENTKRKDKKKKLKIVSANKGTYLLMTSLFAYLFTYLLTKETFPHSAISRLFQTLLVSPRAVLRR